MTEGEAMTGGVIYPWVREGIGRAISQTFQDLSGHEDKNNPNDQKLTSLDIPLTVTVTLKDTTPRDPATPTIYMIGPGDVTGFDPRQVIRTEPAAFSTNVEYNNFPFVEFDRPDFPWLFSPVKPDAQGHLLPWICLVVVQKTDEILSPPDALVPLPSITVTPAHLPDPTESWAWAHAQVIGDQSSDNLLGTSPDKNLSRLLCPVKLENNTTYYACVVPLFDIGAATGLGQKEKERSGRLFAWYEWKEDKYVPLDEGSIKLPVYYMWEFTTGDEGDFKSLATGLKSVKLDKTAIGRKPMRVDALANEGAILDLEGGLTATGLEAEKNSENSDSILKSCKDKLLHILSTPGDDVVLPPVYGFWQASRGRGIPSSPGALLWLYDLNVDPRWRVAAAYGTQVVQDMQEQLMESAWQQVAEIEQANQLLRQAQLARGAGKAIMKRHLEPTDEERKDEGLQASSLALTAPAHAHLTTGGDETIYGSLRHDEMRLPPAALSAAFRRITRPRGPLARRAGASPNWTGKLIKNLNSGALAVTEPDAPLGIQTYDLRGVMDLISAHTQSDAFGKAIDAFVKALPPKGTDEPPHVQLKIGDILNALMSSLDPDITLPRRWDARITRPAEWVSDDPLEPIMAAPEFPTPMYGPLRDLDQEHFLPGVGAIPPDSVSGLLANSRFVEAYLVGLNHEMSRELLWRGYPTDQRGTYFRQFWDPASRLDPTSDTRDIDPISDWGRRPSLGENMKEGADNVVALVRGALLMRYPRTLIYMVKAKRIDPNDPNSPRYPEDLSQNTDHPDVLYPIFHGTLKPDTTFLGFEKTNNDAIDEDGVGWFIVFQEPPAEIRFGLDFGPPKAGATNGVPWDDLTWDDIKFADENPYIQISSGFQTEFKPADTTYKWNTSDSTSADFAFITRQAPVRVARHADDLLTKI